MDDRELGPTRLPMPQPIVEALASIGTGRVRVQAGGFVYHQQMVVFKNQARQHRTMIPLPETPSPLPDHPEPEEEISNGVGRHGIAKAVLADHQPLVGQTAQDARQPAVRVQ